MSIRRGIVDVRSSLLPALSLWINVGATRFKQDSGPAPAN